MNWHFDTKIDLDTKYNLLYYNPTYILIPFFLIESNNYLNTKNRFNQIVEFKKCYSGGPVLYGYCDPNKKLDMVNDVWKDASKYIKANLDLSDSNLSKMYIRINHAIVMVQGPKYDW